MLQKTAGPPLLGDRARAPKKRPTRRALDFLKEAIGAEQHPSSSHR